ncbi:MAG TPA: sodium:alanine symporter family protein [Bacteroidales bacterium]|nr:sodium:alanine symporter family protein [Bacteroidales bacterium]
MAEFLDGLNNIIQLYNEYVGGYLILIFLVPTGIYFAIRFRFLHVRKFWHSVSILRGRYSKKDDHGDVNHFKALTTALAATVGTGNIVGVSLAIYFGGPGAVFWMWVTGFFGMMLKLVECTLALKYRKTNPDGTVSGGPMYYMELGLKDQLGKYAKVLAVVFAGAAVLCALGTGNMAQSNSISAALFKSYQIPNWVTGVSLSLLLLLIVIGGIKRIAEVTSRLVPAMALIYLIAAMVIFVLNIDKILPAFAMIVSDAFTGTAATGGFIGSAFILTLTMGVRRGLFSNEAGQGSAPMAHSAAKTPYPIREGLVSSLEPFIDTLIICTLTALVIIVTGAWQSGLQGVAMTIHAFQTGFDQINIGFMASHLVSVALFLFAFSTIIGWAYYGTRAAQYLFGFGAIKPFYYLYAVFVFFGAVWGLDLVWNFVDMVITFMTIPNLIAIVLLTPVIKKEIDDYFSKDYKTL